MNAPDAAPPQLVAMHGWAGDSDNWRDWRQATAPLGWRWDCGERGYGARPPHTPAWSGAGPRLLIAHSLGPHLLPPEVLAAADAVVLLASFGRFLPPGRQARSLRAALAGMAARLAPGSGDDADSASDPAAEAATAAAAQLMLRDFLARAAAPDPPELLPPGPADAPPGPTARRRLLRDLELLERSTGLPPGFPATVPVLLVEAGDDRIVPPEARALLRAALPDAELVRLEYAGHALLRAPVLPLVIDWLQRRMEG